MGSLVATYLSVPVIVGTCAYLSSNNIRMSKLSRFVSAGVSAYLSVLTKVDTSAYLLAQVIVGTSAGNDGYQYLPLSKLTKVVYQCLPLFKLPRLLPRRPYQLNSGRETGLISALSCIFVPNYTFNLHTRYHLAALWLILVICTSLLRLAFAFYLTLNAPRWPRDPVPVLFLVAAIAGWSFNISSLVSIIV